MRTKLARHERSTTLLARLVEMPDLVQRIRALPPPTFSTLVRKIGVEDSGELVALATTEQLVAAFDEDLFVNEKPGERERFDAARFVIWLGVLLEAGEEAAAARVVELSEDLVAHALSSVIWVLDHDALNARMAEGGDAAEAADKAIESCLSEEIDGYLLVSRNHDGWDDVLTLILALDRDHRAFLVRVLDRCARATSGYLDDLDELATALSAGDSLADDVEGEREERRSKQGWVDPRAARSFLALAREPLTTPARESARDPITRAYFRDLEAKPTDAQQRQTSAANAARLDLALEEVAPQRRMLSRGHGGESRLEDAVPLIGAMRLLGEQAPDVLAARMEELAFLANVLLTGGTRDGARLGPAEAAEAALATVDLGAELQALAIRSTRRRATAREIAEVLRACSADVLFRAASSALLQCGTASFVGSHQQLAAALRRCAARAAPPRRHPKRTRDRR